MDPVLASAIFVLGLAFGSFLNVCIYRLPRGLIGGSAAISLPACGKQSALTTTFRYSAG